MAGTQVGRIGVLGLSDEHCRRLDHALGHQRLGIRLPWLRRLGRLAARLQRAQLGDQRRHVRVAQMLEDLGRHAVEHATVARHSGAQQLFDFRVRVFRQLARQVGRIALVELAAFKLFAVATAATERPTQPLAVGDLRRSVGDLRSVERDFRRFGRRLLSLLLARAASSSTAIPQLRISPSPPNIA